MLPLLLSSLLLSCDSEPEAKAPESPEQKETPTPLSPADAPDFELLSKSTNAKLPEPTRETGRTTIPLPTPQPRVPSSSLEKQQAPPKYKIAERVLGRAGFVYNPWTNEEVDARGIPKGSLIRDPKDSNKDHKFRVPE